MNKKFNFKYFLIALGFIAIIYLVIFQPEKSLPPTPPKVATVKPSDAEVIISLKEQIQSTINLYNFQQEAFLKQVKQNKGSGNMDALKVSADMVFEISQTLDQAGDMEYPDIQSENVKAHVYRGY